MIGWIIYRKSASEINYKDDHTITRLLEEAKKLDIELRIFTNYEINFIIENDKIIFLYNGYPISKPDFVLPRRGANTSESCLILIQALSSAGAKIINSPESINLSKNKLLTAVKLAEHKIPTPKTMIINSKGSIEYAKKHFNAPLIIKKPIGQKGSEVIMCQTMDLFNDHISIIGLNQGPLLVQELVSASYGRDLRILVLNGKAVSIMQRKALNDGYKANFSAGGAVDSHELNDEIRSICEKTALAFGLMIAGVDILFTDDGYCVCEVNSAPGFKGLELASGQNIAKEILLMILSLYS